MHDTQADIHLRTPVVIFLTDADYYVDDETMNSLCRSATDQGLVNFSRSSLSGLTEDANARRPLSFHAVCFGKETSFHSLRRWAEIALDKQTGGVNYPLSSATVPSSYTEAPDSVSWPKMPFAFLWLTFNCKQVRLTETLLGIAESLRKPHI
jgi:hypothetical protein